jgi:two-component system, sensor histidine kinase PdtaS
MCARSFYCFVSLFLLSFFAKAEGQLEKSDSIYVNRLIENALLDGDPKTKLTQLEKALAIGDQMDYDRGVYQCHFLIGNIYNDLSSYENALNHFFYANDYAEKLKNLVYRADVLNAIGGVYYSRKNVSQAFSYFYEAYQIRKGKGSLLKLSGSLNNVADCYRLQGNYKKALEFLFKALAVNQKMGNKRWETINLKNIGLCYAALGQQEESEKHLGESMGIAKSLADKNLIMMVNSSYGEMYFKKKEYNNALEYLMLALGQDKRLPITVDTRDAVRRISKAYREKGNLVEALRYVDLYNAYKDSLFDQEKQNQLILNGKQYQDEKRLQKIAEHKYRSEIEQLEVDNQSKVKYIYALIISILILVGLWMLYSFRIRTTKNDTLRESLEEKDVLLKEIHHRVKNNFQLISSLLNLQSAKITDEIAFLAVKDSQMRINAMALVHQRLYFSEDIASIDMQEYFDKLLEQIAAANDSAGKKNKHIVSAHGVSFSTDTAVPIGLLVSELVTNSYKYAFREREEGRIEVKMRELETGKYTLQISDNGQGLPKELDLENLDSLGLELVQILAEQLDAQLDVKSNENEGLKVSLRFEVAK